MSQPPPFTWPHGAEVAVSLSFDDARPTQLDHALPALNRSRVKATFYVSLPRLEDRLAEWQRAVADGHELGNHSLKHACSANFAWGTPEVLEDYDLARMEAELLEASAIIEDRIGVRPETFAYPCGQTFVGRGLERRSYVPVVARHFLAGRGFLDEHYNCPGICDLAKLGGTELDGLDFESMREHLERARKRGQWVVFAGHDVGVDKPRQAIATEALEQFCEYCTDPGNHVWIAPVRTVAAALSRHAPG